MCNARSVGPSSRRETDDLIDVQIPIFLHLEWIRLGARSRLYFNHIHLFHSLTDRERHPESVLWEDTSEILVIGCCGSPGLLCSAADSLVPYWCDRRRYCAPWSLPHFRYRTLDTRENGGLFCAPAWMTRMCVSVPLACLTPPRCLHREVIVDQAEHPGET